MIEVLTPGLQSVIQATPRMNGYGSGVSPGGAADRLAAALANILLRQDSGLPVLEIVRSPVTLQFQTDLTIALTGGGLSWKDTSGREYASGKVHHLATDTRLVATPLPVGFRSYLAVSGGFRAASFLQSKSTDLRLALGGSLRSLQKGDVLEAEKTAADFRRNASWHLNSVFFDYIHQNFVRVFPAPETKSFPEQLHDQWLSQSWKIKPDSDRMGIRLEGKTLPVTDLTDISSTVVLPGTVQITRSGPIILFTDAQTTGGYPRIGQVCEADLPVLAQKAPGDTLRFKRITLEEAIRLKIDQQQQLSQLTAALSVHSAS